MYIRGAWSAPCPFIVGPTCWRVAITPSRAISSSSSKAELLLHAWSVTSTSYLSQPSPARPIFFFFRCIINCGAHNSVGQVQIIALHVWVTFACNGLGCYQLKDPTDEMGDGEEPRRMRAALESRPRAVPFIQSRRFTFTDRDPSKSTRERGVRPPAHSICCNLFLFCPLVCPLRF